ncbi:PREDICTED: uncharacterized protein LOC107349010 [Acropora digitifera]|uniref:uncharacterized protein LOC107349010 n=1 Tax=Acropora digitifera TaxID=70779 RepID=UPI00077A1644|nr:PREDICTED: uncharacterized protein LOC107349010 [Acropora digitifera]
MRKSIEWKKMATVAVPSEFIETVKVGTSDIKTLPPTAQNFQQELSGKLDSARKKKLKLEIPPPHDSRDPQCPNLDASWYPTDTDTGPTDSDSQPSGTTKNNRKTAKPKSCAEPQSRYGTVAVPSELSETVNLGTSDIKTLPPTAPNVRQQLSG